MRPRSFFLQSLVLQTVLLLLPRGGDHVVVTICSAFSTTAAATTTTKSKTVTDRNTNNNNQRRRNKNGRHPKISSTALSMCQLLGMNCATPTDFTFSMKGFLKRGGETDVHSDGWGVAIYQDNGLRQFHDVEAASTSNLAQYLGDSSIRTLNMMGHIRYATVGDVNLSNVHPFSREMWGIQWCFAHNGEVPLFSTSSSSSSSNSRNTSHQKKISTAVLTSLTTEATSTSNNNNNQISYYHPIGTTDSEATFCAILNALRNKFDTIPSLPVLYESIQKLCREIVTTYPETTILNFLLACGEHNLWVYSYPGSRKNSKTWNGLYYTTREYPFNQCTTLNDMDFSVDFTKSNSINDCVSIIATAPLTNNNNNNNNHHAHTNNNGKKKEECDIDCGEDWFELQKGELILFDEGKPYKNVQDLFRIELSGHGLHSTVLDPPELLHDMKQYNIDPNEFSTFQGSQI